MTYDHGKKVGNKGDVWKHFILLTLLRQLIEQRENKSDRFHYFESHAGQGLYHLKEKGEWRHGIEKVLRHSQLPREHPYFQMIDTSIADDLIYQGSWLLVGNYLSKLNLPFNLVLCDTSEHVEDAIRTFNLNPQIKSAIIFHRTDGFVHLNNYLDHDLALVDPGYHPRAKKDWKECGRAALDLKRNQKTFLIWYPVFWPTKPTKFVEETGLPGFEVHWAPMGEKPSQNQKGCGMLAGGKAERVLRVLTSQLATIASLLDGEIFVREP